MPWAISGCPSQNMPANRPHNNIEFMNSLRSFSLTLVIALMASTSSALACGGGGSGSYRKPARPGQEQHSTSTPASQQGSVTPQNAPQ